MLFNLAVKAAWVNSSIERVFTNEGKNVLIRINNILVSAAINDKLKKTGFGSVPCYGITCDPGVPTQKYIAANYEAIKAGKIKEVF